MSAAVAAEAEGVGALCLSLCCVLGSACAAGLSVALLPLDPGQLRIKAAVGRAAEREAAVRLLPVVQRHHLLLVTLLRGA